MTHQTNAKSNHSIMARILMAGLVVVMMSASSHAQLFYDFVEFPSGDVLATLELTSLPATHTEVAGLTFTAAGSALFGYASPYPGTFDSTDGMFVDDGSGGLGGTLGFDNSADIFDFDPPDSSQGMVDIVVLQAMMPQNNDSIFVGQINPGGNWRLVPEPATSILLLTAVSFGTALLRKRKRAA